jgi:FtsH-binding integral membrane protein
MLDGLIYTYMLLTLVLVAWVWVDMAFTSRLRYRFIWWIVIFMFPVVGSVIYFQSRKRRKFNPRF